MKNNPKLLQIIKKRIKETNKEKLKKAIILANKEQETNKLD